MMVEMRGGRDGGGAGGTIFVPVPIESNTGFVPDNVPVPPGTQTAQGAESCGEPWSTTCDTPAGMVGGATTRP